MPDCGNANAYKALLASAFPRERPERSCEAKNRRYRYGVTKSRHSQRSPNLGWSETLRIDRIRDRRKSLRPGLGYSPLRDGVRGRTIYDVRSARRGSLRVIDPTTTSPISSPSMLSRTIDDGSRLSQNDNEWEKEYRLWLRSLEDSDSCSDERRCSVQDTMSQEEMEMFIKFINFAD
ncbi:hypothetical protein Moror_929 [Moniliophthora roreri MCA 2997]|uniref:Uncharacterized protein n=1 Tax=Moniliophthora roreri (strain MCA 2997) TaxID=1381753 RepID=V2XYQ0_MONRO|nr:hypothetical protein Moror_929 [Moniliophthora roreri MCA 2997]